MWRSLVDLEEERHPSRVYFYSVASNSPDACSLSLFVYWYTHKLLFSTDGKGGQDCSDFWSLIAFPKTLSWTFHKWLPKDTRGKHYLHDCLFKWPACKHEWFGDHQHPCNLQTIKLMPWNDVWCPGRCSLSWQGLMACESVHLPILDAGEEQRK